MSDPETLFHNLHHETLHMQYNIPRELTLLPSKCLGVSKI